MPILSPISPKIKSKDLIDRGGPKATAAYKREADAQLSATRKLVAQIKALQAETAILQQETAANLRETARALRP